MSYRDQVRTYESRHLTPPDQPDERMDPREKALGALEDALYQIEQAGGMTLLHEILSELIASFEGNAHPSMWKAWDKMEAAERNWRIAAWKLGRVANGEDEG